MNVGAKNLLTKSTQDITRLLGRVSKTGATLAEHRRISILPLAE